MLRRCVPGSKSRSACLKAGASESKKKFDRKIQGKVPDRAGLTGIKTEVSIPIEAAYLKKSLLERTITDFLSEGSDNLDEFFYCNLLDLEKCLEKVPDAFFNAVNNRLMMFQLNAASVIDSGESYKEVLIKYVGDECRELSGVYSEKRAEEIKSFHGTLIRIPDFFYSNYLQKSEEGEDDLPGEHDWLVDPDIVEKNPNRYR